jgi:hypothetical protein
MISSLEARPGAGRLEQAPAAFNLRLQVLLTLERGLELLVADALLLRVEAPVRSRGPVGRRPRWRMPCPSRRSMSLSITFKRLPSSFLMVSVFRTSTFEHAVLNALWQNEIMAPDLVGRLE